MKPTFLEWLEETKLPEFEEAAADGDTFAVEKAEIARSILDKFHASPPTPAH